MDKSLHKTMVSKLWDGSFAEAGEIIEWIQSCGGTAEFKETNETVHKKHPEIRVYASDHRKLAVKPDQWVVQVGEGFEPKTHAEFELMFPPVTR